MCDECSQNHECQEVKWIAWYVCSVKPVSLFFYDKEGSILINLHIFQGCAGDKIHILPYCVIWGGLFLLQAIPVILEGLMV